MPPRRAFPAEYAIIKTHPDIGHEILREFTAIKNIEWGAKYHHERYDGKGYSEGLSAEDIPLVGRIISIADAVDAMSARRIYQPERSREDIISELLQGSGTQFDPNLTLIMVDMLRCGYMPRED